MFFCHSNVPRNENFSNLQFYHHFQMCNPGLHHRSLTVRPWKPWWLEDETSLFLLGFGNFSGVNSLLILPGGYAFHPHLGDLNGPVFVSQRLHMDRMQICILHLLRKLAITPGPTLFYPNRRYSVDAIYIYIILYKYCFATRDLELLWVFHDLMTRSKHTNHHLAALYGCFQK